MDSVLPVSNSPVRLGITEAGPSSFTLVGEIDAHSAPMLSERLDPLPHGDADVELDMSEVSFIDSSGLRTLIDVHQRAESDNRRLVLRAPSHSVVRLLEVAGLDGHFHTIA
jgi:anti-sigma B factor antagonist